MSEFSSGRLIFLDFDGVLHPDFSEKGDFFKFAGTLIDILANHAGEVEVVISSSWRFHHDWDELLKLLPEGLRPFIRGSTPEVEPGRHQRYREILAYLAACYDRYDWCAIDDDVLGFPKGCKELIACSGRVGFDEISAVALKKWLQRS